MRKIIYISILIIFLFTTVTYADNELNSQDIIEEQEKSFGIQDFIKETEEYAPEFINEINVSDIFESAISGDIDNLNLFKKILKLLTSQFTDVIKVLINIIIIVLIHSLLKSITEGLNNSDISKIVFYVEYILIVTVLMSNFSSILETIKDAIEDLVGFSQILIPLLITLMVYTGSFTTTTVIEPILLFLIEFISNCIKDLILPVVSIIVVLMIVSKITDRIQIGKLSNFMKSSIVWFLGIVLTVFIGILSLEGSLTSSVDGITAKTTKAAVSSLIPVVGKVLGDGVDAILGCGVILKNAVGIVGVIVIIGICIVPIIKLGTFSIMYALTSSIIEPIADGKIVKLLDEMSGIFKLLLAILCSVSVLLIVGVTLVIKISNSGMMYR